MSKISNNKKTLYSFLILGFIAGVVFYTLHFMGVADKNSFWDEFFQVTGNILVVGVVVGFLTNVLQNFGLFKEELGNVIYAKDYLSNRKDIQEIWLNASKVLFDGKFPKIHDDFFGNHDCISQE